MPLTIQFGKDRITSWWVPFERALSIVKLTTGKTWDRKNKVWNVPLSRENYEKIKPLLTLDRIRAYEKFFNRTLSEIRNSFPFLRPYQVEGVHAALQGKRLVALPLGSGKTLVALSCLKLVNAKKSLVVAPASLLYQWKGEAKKHFNQDVTVLEGDRKDRYRIISELKNTPSYLLALNYEKTILEDVKSFLLSTHFDLVILDEAHKIKNPLTKTHRTLKKVNSTFVILLTATPLVNSPLDIFNLVNFIYPGFFDYHEFCERYIEWKEVEIRKKDGTTKTIKVPAGAKNLQELHARLKPVVFFKTKDEILKDLPPKTEQVYWVKPTKTQVELFRYYYALPLQKKTEDKGVFLACANLMKQIADSTELLLTSDSPYRVNPSRIEHPKIDLLKEEILPFVEGKAIIFTEYRRMAQILQRELKEYKPFLLTGETESGKIDTILDEFEKSDSKILISTDVISSGKNLQFVDTLIHYDLPWSPATALQREGRIHRIGQKNPVTIIKFVTLHSIEKRIFDVLYSKTEQFRTALAGGKSIDIKKVIEIVWRRKLKKKADKKEFSLNSCQKHLIPGIFSS